MDNFEIINFGQIHKFYNEIFQNDLWNVPFDRLKQIIQTNEVRSNSQQTLYKKPQKLYGPDEAQKSGGF